ncbi:unnamed protein product [Blepharisma stoltei]|uniref:Uncharacterized protein n=1 Tax=Blepharisma stoltei TaxID=1481888 RepID=A0AAU9KFZ4_9CILI|nr:unnamed protein product [Blepharisma stoltei]
MEYMKSTNSKTNPREIYSGHSEYCQKSKPNSYHCRTFDNSFEEDEDYGHLPSKYHFGTLKSIQESNKENIPEMSESPSIEEDLHNPKVIIRKTLEEIKKSKFKFGLKIKKEQKRKPLAQLRPQSAKCLSSRAHTPNLNKRKNDPVSMFHKHQNEWKSTSFLNSNHIGSKEGRKLNLCNQNNKKNFEIVKIKEIPSYIDLSYIAPNEKRRDSLRYLTRMKMACQEN